MSQYNDIIYFDNENDDIYKLLADYHRTKNTSLLKELYTTEDYQQIEFENELKNKEVVDQVNTFKNQFETMSYIHYDTKSLVDEYKEWVLLIYKTLQEDLQTAQDLLKYQSLTTNLSYQNIKVSPLTIKQYTKIYSPTLYDRPLTENDGYELFNTAIVSSFSPFLIYKPQEGQQIYKIFNQPLTPDFIKELTPNTLFFNIVINNQPICNMTYNLNKNQMFVDFIQQTYINIQQYLIFPNLKIEENKEDVIFEQTLKGQYELYGEINLWNIEINEVELLNMVLNDDIVNKSFYVVDHLKNLTKPSLHFIYRPLLSNKSISIKITQHYYTSDKMVKYVHHQTYQNTQLKKSKESLLPFITVQFKNVYHYEGFVTAIKMLIDKSLTDTKEFSFGFGLNDLLYQLDVKETSLDINLKLLKDNAPEVFVEGYANFCKYKPRPIHQQDIENYMNEKIKEYGLKGEDEENFKKYAVLQFNTENGQINLVCNHETDKFPYLKSTKTEVLMKNLDKTIYTHLPCCKKLPPKEKKIKQDYTHIISQTFINVPLATGALDKKIKNILDRYNQYENNFMRLGVVQDANSFLHCLCVAIDDNDYKKAKDKSQYVSLLLNKIVNNIYMGVLKQELYDLDVDQMKNKILNGEFLDPALYYRLFEEYFNINIYVFQESTIIDVPRFKIFHARPVRQDRQTVLIYKNSNQYKIYQCELIMNKVTFNMLIYDQEMAIYCHTLLQNYMNTLTFNSNHNQIIVYSNLYYFANHLTMLSHVNKKSISQYIDDNGKLRGLTFQVGQEKMTMLTLPSQPENLKINNSIYHVNLSTALRVFEPQQPSFIVKENNDIIGLWYKIFDVEQGVYIPVTTHLTTTNLTTSNLTTNLINNLTNNINTNLTINLTNIKLGTKHSLITNQSDVGNYYKMKKILSFLIQIVTWLYLSFLKLNIINTINDFFDRYILLQPDVYDQTYNQLIQIPRQLPQLSHVDDFFNYIQSYLPVHHQQVMIYGQQLYDGLFKQVSLLTLNLINPPLVLNNYYQYITDYQKQYNTLIFLLQQNLMSWINQNQWKHELQITQQLRPQPYQYPYLYSDLNDHVYIIQNVENGSYDQALYVAYYWNQYKINLGYHAQTMNVTCKPSIYKTILVSQSDQTLTHLELVQTGSTACKILDYQYKEKVDKKKTSYAALLTLL
jgi:hypothetical protein